MCFDEVWSPSAFWICHPPRCEFPLYPGQTTLGDRGENLSSVLAAICADASKKEALLEWVRKLTPMDVDDLRFDQDAAGRILLRLVEKDGRSVSALSASDGTLRFLGVPRRALRSRACIVVLHRGTGERHSPDAAGSPGRSHRASDQAAGHPDRGDQPFAAAVAVSESKSPSNTLARLPASGSSGRHGSSGSSTFPMPAGSSRNSPCGCCMRRAGSRTFWILPKIGRRTRRREPTAS